MIKLVATDLDGTLLDDNKNISELNIETIKKHHSRGLKVAICTGRTYSEVAHISQYKKIKPYVDYVIYSNGAACIDRNEKTIFSHHMTPQEVHHINDSLNGFDTMFEVYTKGKVYCNESLILTENYKKYITPEFYPLVEDTRLTVKDIMEFSKNIQSQMLLISFLNPAECLKAYDKVKNMDFYITLAGEQGIEFANKLADKGNGILSLANTLGIKKSETLALGDSHNDFPMRKAVDTFISMGNALQELKNIADFVTKDNNEHGVAFALDKYLNI